MIYWKFHICSFVQEQRAAAGALEETLVLTLGARETAFLVAEDLTLNQVGRDRAAVNSQKGPFATAAEVVYGLCHHFLAGAAFAGDEDRDAGAGHARDLLVDAQHGRTLAPQVPEMAALHELDRQLRHLGFQHRWLHDARKHTLQLLEVDGLDEIVGSAQTQRLDRGLDAGVPGAQHDFRIGHDVRVSQQFHAVAIGQTQVEQQDVGLLQCNLPTRVAQRVGHGHGELFACNQRAQRRR